MSTRKRTNQTSENMPPPREHEPLRKKVSPPLANTHLHRLIYLLVGLAAILIWYYSWRTLQMKNAMGGWWNLALGKKPPQMEKPPQAQGGGATWMGWKGQPKSKQAEGTVEQRVSALAEALGVPPAPLASAIAGVVREHVPPASLSAVAARETGPVVEALLHAPDVRKRTDGGEEQGANGKEGEGSSFGVVGKAADAAASALSGFDPDEAPEQT